LFMIYNNHIILYCIHRILNPNLFLKLLYLPNV
jgi:hypothetical protein